MVLARLNTLVYNRPLMLVGSFRNDERPNLPLDLPSMQVIHLERFSEDNTSKLAEAMLGSMKVTAPLLSLLQHETEGNVFFMVEVLRALAEEAGELEQITSSPLPSQVFTGGVEGIIRRRLSRVPKEAQPLLHVAAIAGRELDLTVIRDVLNTANRGDQLDVWLSNCSDAAVLEVDADQWRFSHNKLRDGVLADMPENARRELHKRVATSIQTVYQYTPKQPTAGALAHHWQAAGDFEKEEEYVGLAGEQAFKNDAYQTALQYFNRAIELQDSVDKPKRRQAALMLQLGDTYRVLEQHAEAREIHQQGLELCQAIGYKWGVASNLNSLGNVASETGNPDEAATYYIEALQTAMKIRAVPVALAVLVGMAGLLARVGDRVVATEYIGLVMRHPAVDSITHYLGQRVVQTLREELDEATFEAAYNTGKEQSLREVAERILAEE
jgi:predicted ATPase